MIRRLTPPRLRRAEWTAFAITFLVAGIGLFPLAAALPLLGLTGTGLSARAARGSIWGGVLEAARLGPVELGDVRVRLQLLPLLVGRARVDLAGAVGSGGVSASPGGRGVDDVTAILAPAASLPLPVDRLAFEDFSATFAGGRCRHAEGRLRLTFAQPVAGLALPGGLSGAARCEGGEVVVPLISQSALETLTLRLAPDGSYRARLALRAADPALAPALAAAGFVPTGGGYVRNLAGRL